MSVSTRDVSDADRLCLDCRIDWWDPDTQCTLVASEPSAEPQLWAEYVRGARDSYRKHGVERALELDSLLKPRATSLFLTAVDESGRMVAGVRAKGPYRSADDSHAVVEWGGRKGLATVRKLITDRLPFGVVEIKTAWVSGEPDRSRLLTNALARFPLHSAMLLDAKFAMATSAAHALARWQTTGGVVASQVPATPYPDERYQTKMMWWDRSSFTKHAERKQVSTIFSEFRLMARQLDEAGGTGLLAGSHP
jgi:hypothetical protein